MNHELRIKRKLKYKLNAKRYSLFASRGFTLIELLIVIAIIGVLSAILFANFVGVRQRARDAQRKSDMRQIQAALELYRSDNGEYPATIPSCDAEFASAGTIYMQKIPCNPSPVGGVFAPASKNYIYTSSSSNTYTIKTCLENKNDTGQDTIEEANIANCANATTRLYQLNNP